MPMGRAYKKTFLVSGKFSDAKKKKKIPSSSFSKYDGFFLRF